jgi:hypothetical protein
MANATAASAWQCPTGLTVDPFSRYSGCTVGIELAQFVGWWNLLLWPLSSLGFLFTAVKVHLHDPTALLIRIQTSYVFRGFILLSIGSAMTCPLIGSAAWDPHTPATSDRAIALCGGIGLLVFAVGGYEYTASLLVGIFQMAYSLEQHKAKAWTRRLNWLGLIAGYGHGAGCLITCVGCHLARNQKETDAFVAAGFTCMVISLLTFGCTLTYGAVELRGLQKGISAQSSSGKTLKKIFSIIAAIAILFHNTSLGMLLILSIPWLRHRAGILWIMQWATCVLVLPVISVYELQQLSKRKAAQKHQRQILPTNTGAQGSAVQTSAIANTIAATQQALRSSKRSRRDPSSSLVLDSGVSLAFIETFVRENYINETMTANDAVRLHVKPRTKEIGLDGSGAYVELIGDGKSDSGLRWCGTPTHMLSYSWSYSIATIVAGLRKFERENLPSKGECYYYFRVRAPV